LSLASCLFPLAFLHLSLAFWLLLFASCLCLFVSCLLPLAFLDMPLACWAFPFAFCLLPFALYFVDRGEGITKSNLFRPYHFGVKVGPPLPPPPPPEKRRHQLFVVDILSKIISGAPQTMKTPEPPPKTP